MRICRQCVQTHDDEMFRSYVPRGKGVYNTSVGRNTICKNCESMNNKAARVLKIAEDERSDEQTDFLDKVAAVYDILRQRGGIPVGTYANLLYGDRARRIGKARADEDLFLAVLGADTHVETLYGDGRKVAEYKVVDTDTPLVSLEVSSFMNRLRERSFSSVTEAWSRYDELKGELEVRNLREEAARLLDIWEQEEEDS